MKGTATPLEKFDGWFVRAIDKLDELPEGDGAFAALMIVLPLYERYTVAKLNLTAEQKPLSDKLQGLQQAAADRERQLCAALPTADGGQGTILDRVNRREQSLAARLAGLQQVKPALEQLYQTLTPEQKAVIDHPLMHR